LFEPTITFKKHGMGLGLSIARKNALLLGGDITLIAGELSGAAFRVVLPAAADTKGARAASLASDDVGAPAAPGR
jgi:signal transduction histidine kinase